MSRTVALAVGVSIYLGLEDLVEDIVRAKQEGWIYHKLSCLIHISYD